MTVDSRKYGLAVMTMGIAAICIVTVGMTIQFFNWDFDDAFIIYRYADNIIHGFGWRFNVTENLNASTSVLNTLLISIVALVTRDPRISAHILDALCICAAGTIFLLILRDRYGTVLAGISAVALCMVLGYNNTWGLEINLFIALALLFVNLEMKGLNSWPVLGLLVLARPDGVLILAGKIAVSTLRNRRIPWKGIIQSGLVLLPWVLFSLYEFHQIFPATLKQKMWQGRSGFWGTGWIYWRDLKSAIVDNIFWVKLLGIPASAGVVLMARNRSPLLYIVLFALIQQAAYCVLNVPGYHWYFGIAFAAFMVAALYGASGILSYGRHLLFRSSEWIATGTIPELSGTIVSVCLVTLSIYALSDMVSSPRHEVNAAAHRKLSEVINTYAPPGTLAAMQVGVVGYYTRRNMLDLLGLTTKGGEFATGKNNDKFFRILPSAVVMHSSLSYKESAILNDPRFDEKYVRFSVIQSPGYQDLWLYILKQNYQRAG